MVRAVSHEQINKTAIIGIGGGTNSARSAGVFRALAEILKAREPDLVVLSSGASGNGLYHSTSQSDVLRKIWTEQISSREFLSFKRIPMMNIDFLIDHVLGTLFPLNLAKLREYSIATRMVKARKTRYGTEKDSVAPLELLRASKAMPVAYGREIPLPWGNCIDGQVGCTAQHHVTHALARGATRIIVVDDSSDSVLTKPKKWTARVPEGVQFFHLPPKKLPGHGSLDNRKRTMEQRFDFGFEEARSNADKFLEVLGRQSKKEQGITVSRLIQELPTQVAGAGSTSGGS